MIRLGRRDGEIGSGSDSKSLVQRSMMSGIEKEAKIITVRSIDHCFSDQGSCSLYLNLFHFGFRDSLISLVSAPLSRRTIRTLCCRIPGSLVYFSDPSRRFM